MLEAFEHHLRSPAGAGFTEKAAREHSKKLLTANRSLIMARAD
jgi:hypothetical protein